MKRTRFIVLLLALFVLIAGLWSGRGPIREIFHEWNKPLLPAAQPYLPQVTSTIPLAPPKVSSTPVVVTIPAATSTPVVVDPFQWDGPLPAQVNLAVPFLSQAPNKDWSMPYQEACEEASMIMVHAFYEGQTTAFEPRDGDRAILDLVRFEEGKGKTPDLTIAEVREMMMTKWGYKTVVSTSDVTINRIKSALAHGYPVILPADGKSLKNPNFRNGGPPYHMLVIKGYVGDQYWITNDPGTRLGADFTYPIEHLPQVAHDWNGGDVPGGQAMILVALPNE
ncbi:C39 family peptidase [Patescibacteria group bacterium]|nr:C39 family peptidase [Patescibacteria group bacterium]